MLRLAACLVTLWTFALTPALCAAGALLHACECGDEDEACGHEERCSTDPCNRLIARPESSTSLDPPHPEPLAIPALLSGAPCTGVLLAHVPGAALPAGALPAPGSAALPLRL
jgi:hypothetical protein